MKWNKFQENVSQSFSDLRQEASLYDVTLVSGDLQQIAAHKVVLYASSDLFKQILIENSKSNTLLYLDSIDGADLNLVLDFIYHGQVQVLQTEVERFLDIAQRLKLKGVMRETDSKEDIESAVGMAPPPPAPVDTRPTKKVKYQAQSQIGTSMKRNAQLYQGPPKTAGIYSKFDQVVVQEGALFRCTICGRAANQRTGMKLHIREHFPGLATLSSYKCDVCGKEFKSYNSFNTHELLEHNIAKS